MVGTWELRNFVGKRESKTIDLVYCNAGGGHRSAAQALETIIRDQSRPWTVRLVNLFEILDPQQIFKKATGLHPEDVYNKRLARGWTLGLAQELRVLQAFIRISHKTLSKRLQRHWRKSRPDLVVSLIPNFNRAMFDAVCAALPGVPYVTLLTDLADCPPHFWVEPHQAQHFICGTRRAARQARAVGSRAATVHETSGMIIRPDFYKPLPLDRLEEMRKLGLDPERPTGIVMFGGHGSAIMQRIAADLCDTQLILVCGHNAVLAARLRTARARAPRHIVGFTANIRHYMALSDFFIGKPGPGSLSEALHQGLPVIVVRNAYTMPQERYNTEWVLENGSGMVLKSFNVIRDAVAELAAGLDEYRNNIAALRNDAIFEIPEIFERILNIPATRQSSARGCSRTHA